MSDRMAIRWWVVVVVLYPALAACASDYTWRPFEGHQYALTLAYGNNWQDCENEAILAEGHLATVNSEAENIWLSQTFQVYGEGPQHQGNPWSSVVWIGLEYVAAQWQWSSGEPMTYMAPWWLTVDGQPDGEGNHGYLHPDSHPNPGTWYNGSSWDGQGDRALGIIEVPEPATLSLLALGGLAVLRRRRK